MRGKRKSQYRPPSKREAELASKLIEDIGLKAAAKMMDFDTERMQRIAEGKGLLSRNDSRRLANRRQVFGKDFERMEKLKATAKDLSEQEYQRLWQARIGTHGIPKQPKGKTRQEVIRILKKAEVPTEDFSLGLS